MCRRFRNIVFLHTYVYIHKCLKPKTHLDIITDDYDDHDDDDDYDDGNNNDDDDDDAAVQYL